MTNGYCLRQIRGWNLFSRLSSSFSWNIFWLAVMTMNSTIKIFISYSHQDKQYLQKDSLLGFLQGLERENIEFWTDLAIKSNKIGRALGSSHQIPDPGLRHSLSPSQSELSRFRLLPECRNQKLSCGNKIFVSGHSIALWLETARLAGKPSGTHSCPQIVWSWSPG